MSNATRLGMRIDALLDKVRIAPADQRQKLMLQVRRLRNERALALMGAHQ